MPIPCPPWTSCLTLVGSWAPIVTMVVVVAGLIFTAKQITEARRNNATATAKNIFLDYVRMAFANPAFAKADPAKIKADPDAYDFFVSNMLWALEEIFLTFPEDEAWKNAIKEHANRHIQYIRVRGARHNKSYNTDFLRHIGAQRQLHLRTGDNYT